jgi:hypothetical protein
VFVSDNNTMSSSASSQKKQHKSFAEFALAGLRSAMIEDEVGFRWMRARTCLFWIFDEEDLAADDPLRREIGAAVIRVFQEERPTVAPSARMFTPSPETWGSYDKRVGLESSSSGPLFNIYGFVFFVRCLKSITSQYTIIDQLYDNATTLARTLFSPPLKDLEACLRLPAVEPPAPTSAAVASSGGGAVLPTAPPAPTPAFAASLPPRPPRPSVPPQVHAHPYARPLAPGSRPPTPAAAAASPSVRPRLPTLLDTYRSKASLLEQQEAFTMLQPAILRLFQSIPEASGRRADRTADDRLARQIVCCLPDFVCAPVGPSESTKAQTQRAKARELLNDLNLNTTLVPALRDGRLSPQELVKMTRTIQLRTH